MIATHTFSVISSPASSQPYVCALAFFAHRSQELLAALRADILAERLPKMCCLRGRLDLSNPQAIAYLTQLRSLAVDYAVDMEADFEGVRSISGGILKTEGITKENEAMLKLHFRPETKDLPIHSHEYSERVIYVLRGAGLFSYIPNSNQTAVVESVAVDEGDILSFSRGFKHTFRTSDSDLLLLSVHSPFIPLDDPRQFTIE